MYKVTVIGAGDRGTTYMKVLAKQNNVKLCGVCDILENRTKKSLADFGFENGYSDYKEAIASTKPDIVIVTVPAYLHYDISKYAMENGANVLSEKPFDLFLKNALSFKKLQSRRTGFLHLDINIVI